MPDVIVIGGGVVGTTPAWQIAAAGAEVALLERGALASGATGKSQGLVLPPDHEELVPLWRESLALYSRLADEREFGFDREPIGTLLLATNEAQLAALDAVPHAGERLDAAGVAAAEPALAAGMAGGLLIAEGRRSDPGALAAAAAAEARAAGAEIRDHVEVKRLVPGRRDYRRRAGSTRRWSSSRRAPGRGRWRGCSDTSVEVRPVRGWIALARAGAAGAAPRRLRGRVHARDAARPRRPGHASADLAAGDARRARRRRPSTRWASTRTPTARSSSARRGRRRCTRARRASTACAGTPSGRARWCQRSRIARSSPPGPGLRPFSHDGLPYIGRLDEGLVVCAGHGSEGILTGAGSGRLAAELALGPAAVHRPGAVSAGPRLEPGAAAHRLDRRRPAGEELERVDPLADQHLEPVDDARAPLAGGRARAASRHRRRGRRDRRRSCPARSGSCRSALKHLGPGTGVSCWPRGVAFTTSAAARGGGQATASPSSAAASGRRALTATRQPASRSAATAARAAPPAPSTSASAGAVSPSAHRSPRPSVLSPWIAPSRTRSVLTEPAGPRLGRQLGAHRDHGLLVRDRDVHAREAGRRHARDELRPAAPAARRPPRTPSPSRARRRRRRASPASANGRPDGRSPPRAAAQPPCALKSE